MVGRAERPCLSETTTTEAAAWPLADFAAMYEAAPKPPSSETGWVSVQKVLNAALDSGKKVVFDDHATFAKIVQDGAADLFGLAPEEIDTVLRLGAARLPQKGKRLEDDRPLADAPSWKMPLYVSSFEGSTITIPDAAFGGTVKDLLDRVAHEAGMPRDQAKLHYKGVPLPECETLKECKIPKEATLHLTSSSAGGTGGSTSSTASGSHDAGGAPGVDTDADPNMSTREKRKRKLLAGRGPVAARPAPDPAARAARFATKDGRAAERAHIKNSVKAGIYTINVPPTVHSLMTGLSMLRDLVLVQEDMRNQQDGTLILTAFERTDPVGALARDDNDEGDVREAAFKLLAPAQGIYDYVTARTAGRASQGWKMDRGREPSGDPEERAREAPPWPAKDGGYNRYEEAIVRAASPEGIQAFHAWAKTPTEADVKALAELRQKHPDVQHPEAPPRIPNAEIMCPAGDVLMPPYYVAAPARKSKSVPMLTVVGLSLLIPKARVAISVAPYKIGPLGELNKKIAKTGWIKAGIATLATTLGAKLGRGKDPAEAIAGFHDANLFTYSHDVGDHDINAFIAWAEHSLANGYAIISIHDEADTLTKKMLKDDAPPGAKVPAVERLRPYYSLSKARTILVGATLTPTVEDDSLMGSLLHDDPHDDVALLCDEGLMIPPLEPTDKGQQYVGIEHCVPVKYAEADPNNPRAFTFDLALKKMKQLRIGCRDVQRESAKGKLQAAQDKPVEPQCLDDNGTMETLVQAQARHDATVEKQQKALDEVTSKTLGDFYKVDELKELASDIPSMPQGNLHLFHDEPGTAMLAARTSAFLAMEPLEEAQKRRDEDPEEHVLSKALVVACTSTQQTSNTDLSGGLGGYTQLAIEEAQDQCQPLAVLLYTSIPVPGIVRSTGVPADKDHQFISSDQVKLFLVMRVPADEVDDDGDAGTAEEEYVWAFAPFTAHADAPAALAQAHAVFTEKGCADLIPAMRVIYVGYDMFAAATTLSCSDHTITVDGVEKRVHYLPKSMVLCHAKLKQLNVLYQMLGRSMNLLQSIILDNYQIDVLTHGNTLARVKCYYLIEQYMVKCMKGALGPELRQPDQMMGALVRYAKQQTAAFGMDADDFLGSARVGLRNLTLDKVLARGKKNKGGRYVQPHHIHVPATEASTEGSDDDYDDDDDDDDDDNAGAEDAMASSTHEVARDNFGHRKCIDRPQEEWSDLYERNGGPHYLTQATGGPDEVAAAHIAFMAACTGPEKAAMKKQPRFNQAGDQQPDGKPAYQKPEVLAPYTDLVKRVLPHWFAVLWILVYHKQQPEAPVTEDERVTFAKKHAFRMYQRARHALSFLVCSHQFVPIPNQENWIVQLTTFTAQLGDTSDRRKQELSHMLRMLQFHATSKTGRANRDHANHVTDLHIFLERLYACEDVKAEPWNMKELKQSPDWYLSDPKILSGTHHIHDASVCDHELFTLDARDPNAQKMDYLVLP